MPFDSRFPFRFFGPTTLGALAVCAALWAPPARAGVEACGNIHVEAQGQCELVVEGGCTTQCTPVHMEAACAASLYASCEGNCNELPSVECEGSCQADCVSECLVDPGSFDCNVACNADCQGECSARCSSGDSECSASCEASCSASCDGSCEGTAPSATCEARCTGSCEGSCEASANLDCQASCQAEGFASCKAELQGGCETHCTEPDGALFCDGQYVDYGNNLEECVAALEAQLDIEVEGYAHGSCSGNRCTGEAGGSVSCAVQSDGPTKERTGPVVLAVMTVLLGVARRRG